MAILGCAGARRAAKLAVGCQRSAPTRVPGGSAHYYPAAMRLTAIIPATDAPASLRRCLQAIRGAQDPPDEILCIIDASLPGPAAARNEGVRRAQHGLLVFIDSDVVVHPDAFVRIRRRMEAEPSLDALFGAYDDRPADCGLVSGFRNLLHHHVHQRAPGASSTFWVGLGAVRRAPLVAAGGFDERRYRRPAIEDVELGLRLSDAGARIVLDPTLLGTHLKRWTLGRMLRTDLCHRAVPWVTLLLRRRRSSTALNLGWRHRLSAMACLAALAALAVTPLPWSAVALGAGTAILVALHHPLYALLWRRRGRRAASLGVVLHAVHLLICVLAVPVGLLAYVVEALARQARTLVQAPTRSVLAPAFAGPLALPGETRHEAGTASFDAGSGGAGAVIVGSRSVSTAPPPGAFSASTCPP